MRVGEQVSELVRPGAAPPAVLVSKADHDDPRRTRLRAYARQNGLPLDCGLTKRDLTGRLDESHPARTRLHRAEEVAVELSVAASADSSLDIDVIGDVPLTPEIAVSTEDDFGLTRLLAALRHEVPPPARPAVLVTHRSRFVDTYLEADRVVLESSVITDDGSLQVSDVRAADLRWREPSADDSTIAEALIDDVRVTLELRNEAVLVNAERTDERLGEWIACPDGFSAAEQLGCYDYLCVLGTPGGRLGKRTDEVLRIESEFPSPSECAVAERAIRPVANLVELDTDAEIVPADSASLSALGIQPDKTSAQRLSVVGEELGVALSSRALRPFTAALCKGLEVDEVWQGHGTATHTYQTFDGVPLAPRVDDVGIRQWDFGVCRDGHFYAARTAALCAACGSWACRACDEVNHLASVTCPGCAYSVCPRCVAATHTVTHHRCLLCGDHACVDCGRDPAVAACAMCERTLCASCRNDDLCPACGQLRPITEVQRVTLPSDLAAAGAIIHAGSDKDAQVLVINRGQAYEHAIIRDGTIARWVAFDRSRMDDQYRLRLSASRALQNQVVPTIKPVVPEVLRNDPRVVVQSTRSFHAAWSVPALAASGRGSESQPTPDSDLTAAVVEQFPPLNLCPEPVLEAPARLKSVLESLEHPTTTPLEMHWDRSGSDVAIVPAGISEIMITGTEEQEIVTEWRDYQTTLPWVVDSWHPAPTVRKVVRCRSSEAALVTMAALTALGVRSSGGTEWYVITASKHAPAATLLSRRMGLADADDVGVFTDPNKIQLSSVSNATASSFNVTPHGEVKTGPSSQASGTTEASAVWAPNDTVAVPQLRVLPQELRFLLQRLIQPAPRTRLSIGAAVTQTVTVVGGHEWRYEVMLAPGKTDARRPDQVTRQLLDWGGIDREGHFGSVWARCEYCEQHCCPSCVDGIVTCDCCGTSICRRCVREPSSGMWMCHACTSTRPPTRQEAREHGRLLFTRGMLIGTDPLHTVVVEQSKSRWELHGANGEKQFIANPSVTRYLDQRLAEAEK